MTVHRLQRTQVVPAPIDAVAPFFEAPENLALITPPWMRFRIVTPGPIAMRTGARIDYTLRLLGLPLSWRTVITEFEPVEGGTLVRDTVDYEVPLGPLGELARWLYVARTLEHIFDHRASTIRGLDLAGLAAPRPLG